MRRSVMITVWALMLGLRLGAQQPAPAQTKTLTSMTCPGTGCMIIGSQGTGAVGVQVSGTFVGTIQFEGSLDGTTYASVNMTPPGSTSPVTSTTAVGVWTGGVGGLVKYRVRFSSYSSGSAVITTQSAPTQGRLGVSGGGMGTGTVTSVGLTAPSIFVVSDSPVEDAGTIDLALATETANKVWAGPASGAAATPTFRSLVVADIPSGTGTGSLVYATSPALVTPALGVASATKLSFASGNGLSFAGAMNPITAVGGDDGSGDTAVIWDNPTDSYVVFKFTQFTDFLAPLGWEVFDTNDNLVLGGTGWLISSTGPNNVEIKSDLLVNIHADGMSGQIQLTAPLTTVTGPVVIADVSPLAFTVLSDMTGFGTSNMVLLGGAAGGDIFLQGVDAPPGDNDGSPNRFLVVNARQATAMHPVAGASFILQGWFNDGMTTTNKGLEFENKVRTNGNPEFWIEQQSGGTGHPFMRFFWDQSVTGVIATHDQDTWKLALEAYDVNDAVYRNCGQLLAANVPSFSITSANGCTINLTANGTVNLSAATVTLPASMTTLRGTTGSIGGSPLTAGQCATGNVTVAGATTSMVAAASPVADPDPSLSTGVVWDAFVVSANTVTVRVCGLVIVTPAATTYNVSVVP